MRGKATFRIAGREDKTIYSEPVHPETDARTHTTFHTKFAPIGPVDIQGEKFQVTIVPDTSTEMLLIRCFGFEPLRAKGNRDEMDKKELERRLDQLKSLGYVD